MHVVKATIVALSVIFDRGLATLHQHVIGMSLPRTVVIIATHETCRLLVRFGRQVQHKINIVSIEQQPCSDNAALCPR